MRTINNFIIEKLKISKNTVHTDQELEQLIKYIDAFCADMGTLYYNVDGIYEYEGIEIPLVRTPDNSKGYIMRLAVKCKNNVDILFGYFLIENNSTNLVEYQINSLDDLKYYLGGDDTKLGDEMLETIKNEIEFNY